MAGFKDTKTKGQDRKTLRDLVEVMPLPINEWIRLRFVGPLYSQYLIWFKVKKADGSISKSFPKISLDYDPKTEDWPTETCPYEALAREYSLGGSKKYLGNAIVRDIQEEGEPRKAPERSKSEKRKRTLLDFTREVNIKDGKGSKSWTPIRVFELPGKLVEQIQNLTNLNKVKNKKTGKTIVYDATDDRYGFDISIMVIPGKNNGPPTYQVQKEERTPLTDEEMDYLLWQLDIEKPESLAVAQKEAASIAKRIYVQGKKKDDEDEDDDDYKKKGKGKKKSYEDDLDDDDDDDDSLEDLEDDDDDVLSSKKKKKKSRRDDDDDDLDDDEPPRKKKKKSRRDDDEDDDDEPPRKKKKKKSRRDDDDDDDDDLDD